MGNVIVQVCYFDVMNDVVVDNIICKFGSILSIFLVQKYSVTITCTNMHKADKDYNI